MNAPCLRGCFSFRPRWTGLYKSQRQNCLLCYSGYCDIHRLETVAHWDTVTTSSGAKKEKPRIASVNAFHTLWRLLSADIFTWKKVVLLVSFLQTVLHGGKKRTIDILLPGITERDPGTWRFVCSAPINDFNLPVYCALMQKWFYNVIALSQVGVGWVT